MFLYEVILPGGRSSPNWKAFYENAMRLNARSPDFGGIDRVVVVRHHMDAATIEVLFTENFKGRNATVEVKEITSSTMKTTGHKVYTDLVNDYFLPHGEFRIWVRSRE